MATIFNFSPVLIAGIPMNLALMLGIGLVISSIGYIRMVWFISVGYGYSVAGMMIAGLLATANLESVPFFANVLLVLHCVVILIYGIRLSTYLAIREAAKSFEKEAAAIRQLDSRISFPAKIGIWITVSLLYTAMVSPVVFHGYYLSANCPCQPTAATYTLALIGIVIAVSGIVLESVADIQKSLFKKSNPTRFCDTGVYEMVRFPNYFGEMLVWAGSWIATIPFYTSVAHWLISAAGLIVILLIMMGSAKRLEFKQERRYGNDPKFVAYTKSVPALFPLVPLYSLKRVKIALGWGSHDFDDGQKSKG